MSISRRRFTDFNFEQAFQPPEPCFPSPEEQKLVDALMVEVLWASLQNLHLNHGQQYLPGLSPMPSATLLRRISPAGLLWKLDAGDETWAVGWTFCLCMRCGSRPEIINTGRTKCSLRALIRRAGTVVSYRRITNQPINDFIRS